MRVRAIEMGFYDGSRRRAGSVFDLKPGDKVGKWMVEVKSDAVAEERVRGKPGPKPKGKGPETFAELNSAVADSELQPWAAAKK